MFGLFTSPEKQMRDNARNWLELSERVYHYRRDQLSDADLADLQKKTETLRAQLRDKAGAGKLKLSIEALEPVLRSTGGRIYPQGGMREWFEFFVVASILLIGLRLFFIQPFKIPTNSMWPTYNGMVPEVHATLADEPGAGASLFRKIAYGATTYRVDAPADGEVLIPLDPRTNRPLTTPSMGRTWIILPQKELRYYLLVGNQPVSVSVPEDFAMEWALKDTVSPQSVDYAAFLQKQIDNKQYVFASLTTTDGVTHDNVPCIRTGKTVRSGGRVLSFDIITGDQLMVDRISYHFVRPEVGSGFVFQTNNIAGTTDKYGNHIDSYYIKRLAGVPGDVLEIRPPMLYRNGAPITGAQAFADNIARKSPYRGYGDGPSKNAYPEGLLQHGQKYTVSKNGYVALGDNSYNSQDSRYWGEVPKKDAVGRPLWVFYPFGKHWGPAK